MVFVYQQLLKTESFDNAIPGVLIGLAAMRYQSLYHARERGAIKSHSGCSSRIKSAISVNIS